MSCLSIKLPPAKSAWKSFTSKLQKLHRSKAIKKRKTQTHLHFTPAIVTSINPFLRLDPRSSPPKNLLERARRLLLLQPRRSYLFKKKHKNKRKKNKNKKKKPKTKTDQDGVVYVDTLFKEPTPIIPKMLEHSSNDGVAKNRETADEMWESMGLASPLMYGIDERAEEFIARVRAEMKFQERIARGL